MPATSVEHTEISAPVARRTTVTRTPVEVRVDEPQRVHDAAGRLLFEHFPESGRSVVHVPYGNLELRADHGAIELWARDAVRVRSGSTIELSATELRAHAERGHVEIADAKLVARTLTTMVDTIATVAGVVETKAARIVERAGTAYREIEDLAQTRAGRLRQVARTTLSLLGRRTVVKAEEDLKLKGETIHLA